MGSIRNRAQAGEWALSDFSSQRQLRDSIIGRKRFPKVWSQINWPLPGIYFQRRLPFQETLPTTRIDGVDLLPVLQGNKKAHPGKSLYYYQKNSLEAVRTERWKLVLPHGYRSYDRLPGQDGLQGDYAQGATDLALYDSQRAPLGKG